MRKNLIIALLAASMLATLATGCDKKDDTKKTGESTSSAAETPAAGGDTTTEKKEETTVTETKAPETSKKETTAPPNYVYTEVFTLDFTKMEDTDAPAFEVTNIDNFRIEGGALKGTATNGDPYFIYNGGDFEVNGDEVNWIEIMAKNLTDTDSAQFFFITPQTGWAEGASVKFWYDDCGEGVDWTKVEIEPDESAEWYGTINNFRLDPLECEGDFEIQSIKFMIRSVEK